MDRTQIPLPFNIDSLIEFVKPYYKDKDIMHDLSHIDRVLLYVEKIINSENVAVDNKQLIYAAYFHGFIYTNEQEIKSWLQSQELTEDEIQKIIKIAWESQKDKEAETIEGKILHDAHMIEGGKTYLIVKSLITGSVRGQSLNETIDYIENHLIGKEICYLEQAKKMYSQQQAFAKEFIKDLKNGLK